MINSSFLSLAFAAAAYCNSPFDGVFALQVHNDVDDDDDDEECEWMIEWMALLCMTCDGNILRPDV